MLISIEGLTLTLVVKSPLAWLTVDGSKTKLTVSPAAFEFSMNLPAGWKMEPEKISATIAPHEKRDFRFSIIVPEDVTSGDYIGTGIIVWGEDTYIRETVLTVGGIPYYVGIIVGMVIVAAIVAYFVRKSRNTERPIASTFRKVVDGIRG